jgi:hypothetical protein
MRTIDLKATVSAVIIALAVAAGLVPTGLSSSQAGHRAAAVTVVAHGHYLVDGPDNNPWD